MVVTLEVGGVCGGGIGGRATTAMVLEVESCDGESWMWKLLRGWKLEVECSMEKMLKL